MPRPTSALGQLRAHRTGTATKSTLAAEPDEVKVGAYERISDAWEDASTGVTTQGVDRQAEANEHIAQARGWVIARHYVDNDVSAYKAGVVRDAFEDMLEDLAAGVIQGIVCYNLDRFARQVTDLERAIAIYDQARREKRELMFATAEGDLNLASDDGLTMARVMVAFANKASRDTARRVAMKQREQRDEGTARFGVRPFGWEIHERPDGSREWRLVKREAELIRLAVKAITEGSMSWEAITRAWNEAGLKTPRGNLWTSTTVKNTVRSPRLAGWLMHKGRIAEHSKTGELIRAKDMPAILTDEEYEAFLVADEELRSKVPGNVGHDGTRRYLLSGIARCASCGAPLLGGQVGPKHKKYPQYRCTRHTRAANGQNGCGKVSISAPGLDSLIEGLVVPRLIEDTSDVEVEVTAPWQDELHELQTEKDQLWSAYRERQAPSELVFPRAKEIEDEIERLRRLQAQWRREQRVRARSGGITEESWKTLDLEERTRHIADYIEAVYVSPATTRRGNRFDPSRVAEPLWRARAGDDEQTPAASA